MLALVLRILGVYWLYEKWLRHVVLSRPLPKHVAIIVDGNRRWALKRGWPVWLGHRAGADRLEEILEYIVKLGVETVTLFALSTENLRRDPVEVGELFKLIRERAQRMITSPLIHSERVSVRILGRRDLIPSEVRKELEKLETVTSGYRDHFLNIAVAYGGRAEIVDAVRIIAARVKNGLLDINRIDEKTIEE
ncbi:MAG: polyprenyl diphosphate synthase, partial [Nitrososphaerota archaeon]